MELDAQRASAGQRLEAEPRILVGEPIVLKPAGERRLLALKLDHLGDFIIGLPAMRALRESFKDDHITLVCGSWSRPLALEAGVADEVQTFDYFSAVGWTGEPAQDLADFDAATVAGFDIAIDLRVDTDTRPLLERVDAALRCGIGSRDRFPFLDVILPAEPIYNPQAITGTALIIAADRFHSGMRRQGGLIQETSGPIHNGHLIFGPYLKLPAGRYKATFGLRARGCYVWPAAKMIVDVVRDEAPVVAAAVTVADLSGRTEGPSLVFDNPDESIDEAVGRHEFRVHLSGRSLGGSLEFAGVRLERTDVPPPARRLPVELHIGEKLSLLVELIRQRVLFTPPRKQASDKPSNACDAAQAVAALAPGPRIMVSPLSNKALRDWPGADYARLIGLLLEKTDAQIVLLGAASQTAQLDQLAVANADSGRILNLGGRTTWLELEEVVRLADLVICNNSGVAHLAAGEAVPTLAIYSAAVQPQEWGPRGPRVRTLMADVPCSPCGYDKLEACPHDYRCMRLITPEFVLDQVLDMLRAGQVDGPGGGEERDR